MTLNYLELVRGVPLNFSSYQKPTNKEIVISIGKGALTMYLSFVEKHPAAKEIKRLFIVPSGMEVGDEFLIDTVFSTHPLITEQSFSACDRLINFIKQNIPEKITVLISGGSSALIEKSVQPEKTIRINEMLLKSGRNIIEMNRIRSENSLIKNGKLAETFPNIFWQVFVMSDIPFENGEKFVGSMPFFRDDLQNTSIFKCADSNSLHDHILSNMRDTMSVRNFTGTVAELTETIREFINKETSDLLITGEPSLKIEGGSSGAGGRMSHLALSMIPFLNRTLKFYALSSDGIDGNSAFAGAVIENISPDIFEISQIESALRKYDSATLLEKEGLVLRSGYTGINLNDFVILLRN